MTFELTGKANHDEDSDYTMMITEIHKLTVVGSYRHYCLPMV